MTSAPATAPATAAWPLELEPWDHQVEAFAAALPHPGFMLAIPMGGGKGATAIAIAEHDQAKRVLIACPKNVVGVWPEQFREHAARDWHVWSGQVNGARGPLKNPSIARRAAAGVDAQRHALTARKPYACVVNLEACWQGQLGQLIEGTDWDLVVIDECHRIKAAGGKASRFLGRVGQRVRARGGRVLGATGTPMPHSPLDLYAQYRALDPSIFGTSAAAFRAKFAGRKILRTAKAGEAIYLVGPNDEALQVVGRRPGGQPVRLGRAGEPIYAVGPKLEPLYEGIHEARSDEFAARAGQIMYRLSQEDLDERLGLEDPTDVYRTCDLDAPTRKVYDELERDLIARADDGVVTAANAMVLVLRLAQATNGFYVDADTHALRQLGDAKQKLLDDVLEDLPLREPVVVFGRFHHDLDAIRAVTEKQGRRYGELSGRRRDGLTADSTMSEDIDVLGCQLQAGGVGINLTRARYGIYFALDFKLADYLQSRKRLHRPGQARHVTYVHLLAENTVDRAVYGALRRREEVINAVLDRLKQGSTP